MNLSNLESSVLDAESTGRTVVAEFVSLALRRSREFAKSALPAQSVDQPFRLARTHHHEETTMKASNRAMQSLPRVVATLAAGILAVSGLAMGTAIADSNPMPPPQRGTLFSQVQPQASHRFFVASTGDASNPGQTDSRKDSKNVVASQPQQEHRINAIRKLPPFGPQGPRYR